MRINDCGSRIYDCGFSQIPNISPKSEFDNPKSEMTKNPKSEIRNPSIGFLVVARNGLGGFETIRNINSHAVMQSECPAANSFNRLKNKMTARLQDCKTTLRFLRKPSFFIK
jgi:hypothetical protein